MPTKRPNKKADNALSTAATSAAVFVSVRIARALRVLLVQLA